MKKFLLKKFDIFKTLGKKKSAVRAEGAENLDELRQYAEELYNFVCDSCGKISDMMKAQGLEALVDENGNLLPEVDKYPDLKNLYLERRAKKKELNGILYSHPEMWQPIEDDASMYYNDEDVCRRIDIVTNEAQPYINELGKKRQELTQKTGVPVDVLALLRDKDIDLDVVPSKEIVDLMNENFYITNLYLDAKATMGDQQDKILWDAVPKVIKGKYVKFVNDKMVEILASDDRLVDWVKNFDVKRTDPDAHEYFIRVLERKLNSEFFDKVGCPIKINLYFNTKAMESGFYNTVDKSVNFNTAFWAYSGGKKNTCDVNNVIGVIKHEILGHYANYNLSELGLYGSYMKNFMKDVQSCTHAGLTAAADIRVLEAKSPLLKQSYLITLPEQKVIDGLVKSGWKLSYDILRDDFDLYQNTFEERSAWLITPTKNIVRQIDAYRASHGLGTAKKSR